jgi:hypothetical protein
MTPKKDIPEIAIVEDIETLPIDHAALGIHETLDVASLPSIFDNPTTPQSYLNVLTLLDSMDPLADIDIIPTIDLKPFKQELCDFYRCPEEELGARILKARLPNAEHETIIARSDFKTIEYLLISYERLILRIPGIRYKTQKAEAHVTEELKNYPDRPRKIKESFVGTEIWEDATVVRVDIRDSSIMKQAMGATQSIQLTESNFFEIIQEILREHPKVHLVETGGDEAVFISKDENAAVHAANALHEAVEEMKQLKIATGIAKGKVTISITRNGRFLIGGDAYKKAEMAQGEAKDEKGGSHLCKITTEGKIQIDDAIKIPESHDFRDINEPSDIRFQELENLDPKSPKFTEHLKRVIGLVASTAASGTLEHDEINYPEASILCVNFTPPKTNGSAKNLQEAWEETLNPIEQILDKYGGSLNYVSSDGKMIIFFGAFQSSPINQATRAAKCANELLEVQAVKYIAGTKGEVAIGPMGGRVTGGASKLDLGPRIIGILAKLEDPTRRIGFDEDLVKALGAKGHHLITNGEKTNGEEIKVRSFGWKTLFLGGHTEAPERVTIGVIYNQQLQRITAKLERLKHEENEEVELIVIEETPGMESGNFFKHAQDRAKEAGYAIVGNDETQQSFRAYGFIGNIFKQLFDTPEKFMAWAITENIPSHERVRWKVLYQEIVMQERVVAIQQDPEEMQKQVIAILKRISKNEPLCILATTPSKIDTYSKEVLEQLRYLDKGTSGGIAIIAKENGWKGPIHEGSTIKLEGIEIDEARALIADELGLPKTELGEGLILFLKELLGTPPPLWPPFLVREVTSRLKQEPGRLKPDNGDFNGVPPAQEELPQNVYNYTFSKYNGLSPLGKKLFRVAALLGVQGSEVDLNSVFDSPSQVSVAKRELSKKRIIVISRGKYRFVQGFMAPQGIQAAFGGNPRAKTTTHQAMANALLRQSPIPDIETIMEQTNLGGIPEEMTPFVGFQMKMLEEDPLNAKILGERFLEMGFAPMMEKQKILPQTFEGEIAHGTMETLLILAKAYSDLNHPYFSQGPTTKTPIREILKQAKEFAELDSHSPGLKAHLLKRYFIVAGNIQYAEQQTDELERLIEEADARKNTDLKQNLAEDKNTEHWINLLKSYALFRQGSKRLMKTLSPEEEREKRSEKMEMALTILEKMEGEILDLELIRKHQQIQIVIQGAHITDIAKDELKRLQEDDPTKKLSFQDEDAISDLIDRVTSIERKFGARNLPGLISISRVLIRAYSALGRTNEAAEKAAKYLLIAESQNHLKQALSLELTIASTYSDGIAREISLGDLEAATELIGKEEVSLRHLMQKRTTANGVTVMYIYLNVLEHCFYKLEVLEKKGTLNFETATALKDRIDQIFALINEAPQEHQAQCDGYIKHFAKKAAEAFKET